MMTAFTRTLILYFLIMLGLRLMGKRQIAELEPSELVLTMMISDLASVPMQDFGIPLLAGIIPILTLMASSLLLSHLFLQNLKFRELVCGTPSILIRNGQLQQPYLFPQFMTTSASFPSPAPSPGIHPSAVSHLSKM